MGRRAALLDEKRSAAVAMYRRGASLEDVGAKFSVSITAVRAAVKAGGIKLRTRSETFDANRPDMKDAIKSKVKINPKSDCWEWIGWVEKNGYGRMTFKRKTGWAHRYAYEAHLGKIPKGMDVCHTCDNRKCCNPEHLFVGTRKDNMQDCMRKGRTSRGLIHSVKITSGIRARRLTKLTMEKARLIRQKKANGATNKDLAGEFGVDVSSIRLVVSNRIWRENDLVGMVAAVNSRKAA